MRVRIRDSAALGSKNSDDGHIPFLKDSAAFDILRRLQEENAQTFYAMLID